MAEGATKRNVSQHAIWPQQATPQLNGPDVTDAMRDIRNLLPEIVASAFCVEPGVS